MSSTAQGSISQELMQALSQRDATEAIRSRNAGSAPQPLAAPQPASPPQGAPGDSQSATAPPPPDDIRIPVQGGNDGSSPMQAGAPNKQYPNLSFGPHVDWAHVNPALLQAIDHQAAKMGVVATVLNGYHNNTYASSVGGTAGDGHTKGTAVDAFVHGHPIGEVIPPPTWQKLGITSGIDPAHQGAPDPAHLELTHVVLKAGGKVR